MRRLQLTSRSGFNLVLCIGLTSMVGMALSFGSIAVVLPLMVGLPTLLLLLGQTMLDLFFPPAKRQLRPSTLVAESSAQEKGSQFAGLAADPDQPRMPFWIAFLWAALFYLGYSTLGYIVTVPVLLLAYLRLQARASWCFSLLFSVALGLFVYVVFHLFMGLRVF